MCVCVCVCVLCVGVCRDGAGRAYTPSRASDRGVFFVRLCGFLFAWVQYCVCVLVCVGVRGREGGSAAMKQLPVGLTRLQC